MSGPAAPIDQTDIVAGLQRVGIGQGSLVEVHASLSSFGRVDGGAETIIDALLETVGPQGTIVMPSYPVGPGLAAGPEELQRGITWIVRVLSFEDHTTRTGMGVIADRFRDRADVVRNVSSFFSYSAWGRDAALVAQGLDQVVARGGQVLLLGVQMDRCSCLHLAEDRVSLPVALAQLRAVPEEIQRAYPEHEWRIGYGPEANFLIVQLEAEARGMIRTTTIGRAEVRCCDARTIVNLYIALLRENPYRLFEVDDHERGRG